MIIKKKLRDLTFEEYKDWKFKNCTPIKTCTKCEFGCVTCSWFPNEKTCWVNNQNTKSNGNIIHSWVCSCNFTKRLFW